MELLIIEVKWVIFISDNVRNPTFPLFVGHQLAQIGLMQPEI